MKIERHKKIIHFNFIKEISYKLKDRHKRSQFNFWKEIFLKINDKTKSISNNPLQFYIIIKEFPIKMNDRNKANKSVILNNITII